MQARALLEAAGWKVAPTAWLRNAKGEPFEFEYLDPGDASEPAPRPGRATSRKLGIRVQGAATSISRSIRKRLEEYDFDMITIVEGDFSLPSAGRLRDAYGSEVGRREGRNNFRGVKSAAVDHMLDAMEPRAGRSTSCATPPARSTAWSCANHWQVPELYGDASAMSYWDKFGIPARACPSTIRPPTAARLAAVRAVDDVVEQGCRRGAGKSAADQHVTEGSPMLSYILKRLLLMIPTLLGVLTVTFVVIQFVPGGPVEQLMAEARVGRRAAELRHYRPAATWTPSSRGAEEAVRLRQAAVRCATSRCWRASRASTSARSYIHNKDVWQLIKEKLPVSISLGLWTFLITYLISIPLGIAKAVREGSRFDVATTLLVLVGFAIPGFVLGVLLIVLFAGGTFLTGSRCAA